MASGNKRFHRNFRFNVSLRIVVLLALAFSLAYVMSNQQMLFAPVAIAIALVVGVFNLVSYIEKTNRDLTHFLLSLREGAFTESYTAGSRGKHYEELSDALNEVVKEFASLSLQKELHYQYLQVLNENINVAILSFAQDDTLMTMNPAAKRLLNIVPVFSTLDHFKLIDPALFNTISTLKPGQRAISKVVLNDEQIQLAIQTKEIILQDKPVKILLLQNLTNELESNEIEAWHQLMRILTHEIMNSITPITSLSSAAKGILQTHEGKRKSLPVVTDENLEDVFSSVSTIESRSKGLLTFVKAYREYAKPSEAKLEPVNIITTIQQINSLMKVELQKRLIELNLKIPSHAVEINADASMIEQVLLNLLKNAIEAVDQANGGKIIIDLKTFADQRVELSVIDNGEGIDEETLSKIFIPFFTTKESGTGIGLSLCKQIMKLHNGTIRASSTLGKGSVFTLTWN